HRFHGRSSLRFVYQHGQTIRGASVALRFVKNGRQPSYRVAVVVSRKVSKSAVVRNRIRRRIYEIVRNLADQIPEPYDMVFTVYSEETAELPHSAIRAAVLRKLKKAGIIRGAAPPDEERGTISTKEEKKA